MMRGRPAVYATFSSYDEVAHHSGLERADTLEALRKLDQQFGRIDHARRYAPRPYEIVVLSDHGQTQGATFKQRNGYGLDDLVERSLASGSVHSIKGGDEQHAMAGLAVGGGDRHGRGSRKRDEERGRRPQGRRARLGQPRSRLPHGRAAAADARGDRRAAPAADPGASRASARRLDPRPLERARRARARRGRHRTTSPRAGSRATTRSRLLAQRAASPAAHGRLPARRRPHGRQLLRPRPRRGLRVRGADLVPRRARRPADAAVHPPPGRSRRPTSRSSAQSRCTRVLSGWRRSSRAENSL